MSKIIELKTLGLTCPSSLATSVLLRTVLIIDKKKSWILYHTVLYGIHCTLYSNLAVPAVFVLGRGPGFESGISHNDPDALQDHCVLCSNVKTQVSEGNLHMRQNKI